MRVDCSPEIMESKRKWHNISEALKEKNCELRIICPVKIIFRNEGEIKALSYKGELKEFITSRPPLKERLKDFKQKIVKEGILEHQEERTMESKSADEHKTPLLEFSKLCLLKQKL